MGYAARKYDPHPTEDLVEWESDPEHHPRIGPGDHWLAPRMGAALYASAAAGGVSPVVTTSSDKTVHCFTA